MLKYGRFLVRPAMLVIFYSRMHVIQYNNLDLAEKLIKGPFNKNYMLFFFSTFSRRL